MPAPDYEREFDLFNGCLELTPPERHAYLDRHCTDDPGLRHRIERLIAAHVGAENATLNPLQSAVPELLPESIGPYRILRLLGEGGMGAVYEAEQLEPVRRRVALKIVKLGMDTRQVVARFLNERQALAAMDHPHVARVFDAGQTLSGRPYFVMELVEGVPLLEFARRRTLSVRQRVELFSLICLAVQHAHQKGVIHRDLKPSNVLIAESDGAPAPKIIDFGIAKAVGFDSPDAATELTRAGHILGTPAYMSPEQAALGAIDVDTRADVYSLGVMLYELLAGKLPADPAGSSDFDFLSRLAKGEFHPTRPSLGGRTREIAGDLDWIVMKALEVDRERRYVSAAALAADLARYLRCEPVAARPPSLSYRLSRFVQRHRVQVLAAVLVTLSLLAGALAAGIGFLRARRDAATARQVSDFVVRLFEVSDPGQARGNSVTARELLDRGAATIERDLKQQPEIQANLLATLSRVHESLGLYRESKALAEKSLAARTGNDLQTAAALHALGRAQQRLGSFVEASATLDRALQLHIRLLGEDHLEVARVLDSLGSVYFQQHKINAALATHQRALAILQKVAGPDSPDAARCLRSIGGVQNLANNYPAALEANRRALDIFRKSYGELHPSTADALHSTGLVLQNLKRLPEAQQHLERALEIRRKVFGPDHPLVAYSLHNVGRVMVARGNLKDALPLYEEGIRIREAKLGADHPLTADLIESFALLKIRTGDLSGGTRLLERSLRAHLAGYGPEHIQTVQSHLNLTKALLMARRYEEAIPHIREVALRDVDPNVRIDLKDHDLDPLRSIPAFQQLEADLAQRRVR